MNKPHMSTRVPHPLDEHFRSALEGAEADPPKAVWEGIVRARTGRGGSSRTRWAAPLAVLLLLGGGGGAYFLGTSGPPATADRDSLVETRVEPASSGSVRASGTQVEFLRPVSKADAPVQGHALQGQGPHGEYASFAGPASPVVGTAVMTTSPVPARSLPVVQPDADGTIVSQPSTPDASQAPRGLSMRIDGPPPLPGMVPDASPSGLVDAVRPDPLAPLRIDMTTPPLEGLPLTRPHPGPYVLPKGEWWAGPQAGWFSTRYRWAGSDDRLVEALDRAEVDVPTFAVGLALGHDRRNGWGISTGIMYERSEQAFRHVERRTETSQEIIPRLVTLNTRVFQTGADTVVRTVTEELGSKGVNRRTVLRVPLEAHWRHRLVGRWTWGLRAGLVAEHTSMGQGLSLGIADDDARVTALRLDADALRARYPLSLLGTVGADLGFMPHERWTLWASPLYMRGLLPVEKSPPAYAMPERWGLQVRLTHHFLHLRSK